MNKNYITECCKIIIRLSSDSLPKFQTRGTGHVLWAVNPAPLQTEMFLDSQCLMRKGTKTWKLSTDS